MIDALVSWPTFVVALFVFGFAPRTVLRVLLLAFPRGDVRREELRAELDAVPRAERPFWVLEQLEVALFEGIPTQIRRAIARRRDQDPQDGPEPETTDRGDGARSGFASVSEGRPRVWGTISEDGSVRGTLPEAELRQKIDELFSATEHLARFGRLDRDEDDRSDPEAPQPPERVLE